MLTYLSGHKHASFNSNHIVNYSVPRHQHHKTVIHSSFKSLFRQNIRFYCKFNYIKSTLKFIRFKKKSYFPIDVCAKDLQEKIKLGLMKLHANIL